METPAPDEAQSSYGSDEPDAQTLADAEDAQKILDTVPATVDEALTIAVNDLNKSVLEKYEPIGPFGSSETLTEEEVEALPADSEHVAETTPGSTAGRAQEARSLTRPADHEAESIARGVAPSNQHPATDEPEPDWVTTRPPFILSFVDTDHPNGGFVIGWDTCGACNLHIRTCKCPTGPTQPTYVKRWRSKNDTEHDKPVRVSSTTKKALVAADPQVVEKAVDEALTDPPRTRKKRADAGKPRGPRKKAPATPDSVASAADDLSAAMSKGSPSG